MSATKKTMTVAAIEAEWLEIQAAQDNPRRFQPLYERYYEPIYRFIYRRTADESLTADVCSQVFLKALQRLGSYQFRGVPFSAWLFRIASNEIAQHYRNSQQRRVVSLEERFVGEMVDEMEVEADDWKVEDLTDALDSIKPEDVMLIELRFFEQRPFKEIAQILGITESNAKVRTYRILERLRKKIETKNKRA